MFDWGAAFWAALVAGTLLLVLMTLVLPQLLGGNAWVILRMLASIPLGADVLAPPASFELGIISAGVVTHYVMSMTMAIVLALVIHRGGFVLGVLGGGVFGLAMYAINIYTLTFFFPWLFALRGVEFALINLIFGATAGGIYEWLEEDVLEEATS